MFFPRSLFNFFFRVAHYAKENTRRQFFVALPNPSSLSIVVEHSVLVVPQNVFGRLSYNLLYYAFKFDGAATFVVLFGGFLVPVVHHFDLRFCNKKKRNIIKNPFSD